MLLVLLIQAALSFTTVARGTASAIDEPREVVIRTPEEWTAVWRQHGASGPAPAVDFSKLMVVGVFLGSRATGGYDVTIAGVTAGPGRARTVEYVERRPGRSDIVAQMLTAPFHLVSIPRDPAPVEFRRGAP
jgi:hypothetical protein